MFRAVYDLSVQYETTPGGTWTILCEGDTTAVKMTLCIMALCVKASFVEVPI